MYPFQRTRLTALLTFVALGAHAADVQVAVAANSAVPLEKISASFNAATGHTLKVAAGSTGKFYSQIIAGAPFVLLIAAGHALAGSNFTDAIGKLVLWSARPGVVDDQGAVLGSGRFSHLAIADPKLAPYGAAALQMIQARGLADALAPKIVTGQSIAQAFQFAGTGNAERGFVALSQVAVRGKPAAGSYWRVPQDLYGEIRQSGALGEVTARLDLPTARGEGAGVVLDATLDERDAQWQLVRLQVDNDLSLWSRDPGFEIGRALRLLESACNLANEPLLQTLSGGAGGGGTRLIEAVDRPSMAPCTACTARPCTLRALTAFPVIDPRSTHDARSGSPRIGVPPHIALRGRA